MAKSKTRAPAKSTVHKSLAIPKEFQCPLCNTAKAVTITLKQSIGKGFARCEKCRASYVHDVSSRSRAADVYAGWLRERGVNEIDSDDLRRIDEQKSEENWTEVREETRRKKHEKRMERLEKMKVERGSKAGEQEVKEEINEETKEEANEMIKEKVKEESDA